jgi:hypothetical protein
MHDVVDVKNDGEVTASYCFGEKKSSVCMPQGQRGCNIL